MNLPRSPKTSRNREKLPLFAVILYGLAGASLLLYIVMTKSVAFADWFNQGIGAGVRSVLSLLTSWIPFSLGEAVILLLPLALFLVLPVGVGDTAPRGAVLLTVRKGGARWGGPA